VIRAAISALWSYWRRQPLQLATLVLGLALATGLWSAVQAINAEARAAYANATAQLSADAGPRLTMRDGKPIALATYVRLRRAGWQVSPVLEGRIRLGDVWVTLMGVDVLSSPMLALTAPPDGVEALAPGDLLTAPGRIFAHPAMKAPPLSQTPSSSSSSSSAFSSASPSLPPVIHTESLPPGIALTDIATAARLLDRPDTVDRLAVLPIQPQGLPPLETIAPELIQSVPPAEADAGRLTDSFHLNLTAFGLLSFAVGLFIVHGTAGLAFQQRRSLFRTLRALGLPARHLMGLVLGELLVLALFGGLLGVVLGYVVAATSGRSAAATT